VLIKRVIALAVASLITMVSVLVNADIEADIANRLSPVGKVCMAGDSCAAAVVQVATGPRTGSEIYPSGCAGCHDAGVLNSPKFGDFDAWKGRISSAEYTPVKEGFSRENVPETIMTKLYNSAINGIGAMPPKGLCSDCSDEEIKASVDYMITQLQP